MGARALRTPDGRKAWRELDGAACTPAGMRELEVSPNLRGMMSDEDMKAELERLRSENAALKNAATRGISMKVSEKGGLSIYGLGRFPITLYKEQWAKLLELSNDIREFMQAHDAELKSKQ